ETVPVPVEWAARPRRVVVALTHGAHGGERAVAHRREGRVRPAGQRDVHGTLPHEARGFADGHRPRGTTHGVGGVRTRHAVLDGDVAARRAGERRRGDARIDGTG